MSELDYKALWDKAKARGAKAAEGRYPESQPIRRRNYAHMVTLREYHAMTRPDPPDVGGQCRCRCHGS